MGGKNELSLNVIILWSQVVFLIHEFIWTDVERDRDIIKGKRRYISMLYRNLRKESNHFFTPDTQDICTSKIIFKRLSKRHIALFSAFKPIIATCTTPTVALQSYFMDLFHNPCFWVITCVSESVKCEDFRLGSNTWIDKYSENPHELSLLR